jgi:hypothetical protein
MGDTETQDTELTPEPADQTEMENTDGEYVEPEEVQDEPTVEEPEVVTMTATEKAMYDKRIADKDAQIEQQQKELREGEKKAMEILLRYDPRFQQPQEPVEQPDLNEPVTRQEIINLEKQRQAQTAFGMAKARVESDVVAFKTKHPELASDPELAAAFRKEFAELNQFDFHAVPPEEILKRQNVFGKNLEVALAQVKANKGNGTVTNKPIPPKGAGAVAPSGGKPALTRPAAPAPKVHVRKDPMARAEEKLMKQFGLM